MLHEAKQALNKWIERLEKGELKVIDRKKPSVPLPKSESKKLLRNYGDFSQMNQTINSSKSSTIHKRFNETPEEWYQYHTLYSQARKEWLEIPYKVIAEYIKVRPDWIVGDFGCGEALLAKELPNKVFSFDHIAINPSVIVSDLSKLNQPDKSLDVGVFSYLMSTNWQDYLKEAQRVIKPGGFLYIAEPKTDGLEKNWIF